MAGRKRSVMPGPPLRRGWLDGEAASGSLGGVTEYSENPASIDDAENAPSEPPQLTSTPMGISEEIAPFEEPLADFAIAEGWIHGVDPRDRSALSAVAIDDAESVRAAVERARGAQQKWASLSVARRARALRAFQVAVMKRGDELQATLASETGKTEAEGWLHEVLPTADLAEFWCEEGPEYLRSSAPSLDPINYPGKSASIERVPRGVVGLITPWNFPVAIPLRTIFPALLSGNAVVMKPSEYTPRCAAILGAAADSSLGPGLLTVVQGGGETGAALVASGVDSVVFTGSVNTGRKVAHAAADAMVPVSLELGGKDAALVLDDAPLERAARGLLWGAMCNSGQNCASVERIFVTPGVEPAFRERIAALANAMVPGRDYGPLTNATQLGHVMKQIEEARAAGATVVCGGRSLDRRGYWYEPTVMTDVPADCSLMQDETFGPVVVLSEVADQEAGVKAVNDSRYGLTASVWTRKLDRGERLAREMNVGVVMINNHGFTGAIPALPWAGVKESGYGVTNSHFALDHLTRPLAVIHDRKTSKTELWWYPYSKGLVRVARSMSHLRGGASALGKVKHVGTLLGGFATRWRVRKTNQSG